MTERKGTPDILGEILGGGSSLPAEPDFEITQSPVPAPDRPKRPSAVRKPAGQKPAGPQSAGQKPASQKTLPSITGHWEYQVVSLQHKDGWRPRYVNGRNVRDWENGPQAHEFLQQMDRDGWELISATSSSKMYGMSDGLQFYFRRPPK